MLILVTSFAMRWHCLEFNFRICDNRSFSATAILFVFCFILFFLSLSLNHVDIFSQKVYAQDYFMIEFL